jgi:isopenicillin-N N-acyltransferase like protein
MSNNIEVINVQGSDFECGVQAGRACRNEINGFLTCVQQSIPLNQHWEDIQKQALLYLPASIQYFPYLVEQLQGIAVGSELTFTDIFTLATEEVFDSMPDHCTDIAVAKPTPVLGHNNDFNREHLPFVTVILWQTNRGKILSAGLATYMCAGIGVRDNGYAIALFGNELSQNDAQIGIPRLLVSSGILEAENMTQALDIASIKIRATSYNHVIADSEQLIDFEGSATDYRLIYPDNRNTIIHANHYLHPEMQRYAYEPNHEGSKCRHTRAQKLTAQISDKNPIVPQIKEILRDHGEDNSASHKTICKHDGADPIPNTVFSIISDMESGEIWFTKGPPCKNDYQIIWQFK